MRFWLWGEGPLADAALAASRSLRWDVCTDAEVSAGTADPAGRDVVAVAPLATTIAGCATVTARPIDGRRAFAWPMISVPAVQQLVARTNQVGALSELSSRATRPLSGRSTDVAASFLGGAHDQIAMLLLLGQIGGIGRPRTVSVESTAESDRLGLHYDGLDAAIDVRWSDGLPPALDVQVAGTAGVLRVDTDPETRLEHNGETVALPTPAPVDPSIRVLRDGGIIDMLKTIDAAFTDGRQLAHAFSFEFGRSVVEVAEAAATSAARSGARQPLDP